MCNSVQKKPGVHVITVTKGRYRYQYFIKRDNIYNKRNE